MAMADQSDIKRAHLPHTGRMLDRRARWSTSLLRGMRFVVLVVTLVAGHAGEDDRQEPRPG
jgi:hypothetical protein